MQGWSSRERWLTKQSCLNLTVGCAGHPVTGQHGDPVKKDSKSFMSTDFPSTVITPKVKQHKKGAVETTPLIITFQSYVQKCESSNRTGHEFLLENSGQYSLDWKGKLLNIISVI